MGKKKQKFYVVWKGRKPGVYLTWDECKKQTDGFSGAKHKSFETLEEAEKAFGESKKTKGMKKPEKKKTKPLKKGFVKEDEGVKPIPERPIEDSFCVDASCIGNPGPVEYRCVNNMTKEEVFQKGPFRNGTNNIGEFLAIVHALAQFKKDGIENPIYSDSSIAIGWIIKKKCKTKLKQDESNEILFDLIDRAEKWLNENIYTNQILKWETKAWGEIPADFGRKK